MEYILVVLSFILIAWLVLSKNKSKGNLPQGPRGLPLLGNFHQIIKDPHKRLSEWVKDHGKLFTIKIGGKSALIISDPKLLKELFALQASTGKFHTDTFFVLSRGPYGMFSTSGDTWLEQRQFCMRSLREYGFKNKSTLEPIIAGEVDEVINFIDSEMEKHKEVASLKQVFNIATNNALWTIYSGQRVSFNNAKLNKLLLEMLDAMQITVKSGLNFMPWLKYIAPNWSGYNFLNRVSNDLHVFIENIVEEHKETHVSGSPRDVIDTYIDEMQKTKEPKSSFYGTEGEKHAVASIVAVLEAGGGTTPYSLEWILLYVSYHPEVQRKLHQEIDDVLGRNRDASLLDKEKMPYTEAVICESLRFSSMISLGLIHELLEDVEFHGYSLPKGLLLIGNLYHIHHDEEFWNDPMSFKPERFLNETGSAVLKKEGFAPFLVGRRICLGETMAKDVLFLFVAKLFQTYDITPCNPEPDFEPDVGISLLPKPCKYVMKKRM